MASAAWPWSAGTRCELVSSVSVIVEWPSISLTIFGWTPLVNSKVVEPYRGQLCGPESLVVRQTLTGVEGDHRSRC
jgi:hypothetical protein